MLVCPEKEEESSEPSKHEVAIQKHVLSPQLVNAISSTAQVLWANSHQTGGLLGKSDVRLQTAVGMPVAVDGNGNMCVVVMFSPKHIKNSDEAMEYLQFISKSATSSTIPCLLPVFNGDMKAVMSLHAGRPQVLNASLGDGVEANFVDLDSIHHTDLSHADKDSFGIPLLPGMELDVSGDAFDEASYGVWNTIMDIPDTAVVPLDQPAFPTALRDRIEEFLTAFLSMSVFDAADIWIPREPGLCHEVTVLANDSLREFWAASEGIFVQSWSGAVGRAHASGNPVWSHVPSVIFDEERRPAFEKAGIQTVLAVPIANCVLCCYSLVRTDAVPFVLKFLQQALRLLWVGLDNVEQPQVGREIWKEVGPTDLGEMAADLEMHHEFLRKKRPLSVMEVPENARDRSESLSLQFDSLASTSSINVPLSSNSQFSLQPYPEEEAVSQPVRMYNSQEPVAIGDVQSHIRDALHAVGHAVPWSSTNFEGTKRAHVSRENSNEYVEPQTFVYSDTDTSIEGTNRAHVSRENANEYVEPQTFVYSGTGTSIGRDGGTSGLPSQFLYTNDVQLNNYTGYGAEPTYEFSQSSGSEQYQPPAFYQVVQSNVPSTANQGVYSNQNDRTFSSSSQTEWSIPQTSSSQIPQAAPLPMPHQLPSRIVQAPAAPPGPFTLGFQVGSIGQQQYQQVDASGYNRHQLASGMNLSQQFYQVPSSQQPVPTPTASAPLSITTAPSSSLFHAGFTSSSATQLSSGGKGCRIEGCCEPAIARRPYCVTHSGNRLCEQPGCGKCAQGSTRFCIAHGGGRRCTFPGCDKGARDKFFCAAHGGGKRCAMDGCCKSAVGGSSLCTGHGGGRRCSVEGCDKSAQSSTRFCVKHGGGKTCGYAGCPKVARGRTPYCAAHGGGIRCKLDGCNRVAIGKLQLCRAHGGGARTKASSGITTNSAVVGLS